MQFPPGPAHATDHVPQSELKPFTSRHALTEFLEIDPDTLTAAKAGHTQTPRGDAVFDDRIDAWPEELPREEMTPILNSRHCGRWPLTLLERALLGSPGR